MAGIVLAGGLTGLLVALAVAPVAWLETGDRLASVGGALVAVAGLVVSVLALRAASRPVPADPALVLERARGELVVAVRRQWAREARARGLLRPEPLRVRWSEAERPGQGEVTQLAAFWRRLPARQLVVVGPAGAGKTSLAVLLVNQLTDDPRPGEPVPVLVSLSSWDPREDWEGWFARRIAAEYPMLARFGTDIAARLVAHGLILPVLDGLDELTPAARPAAIQALGDAVGNRRPVVLTCRSPEYEDTIAQLGVPLGRASVVEILPLTGEQVREYLPDGQVDGQRRWAPVLARLREDPHGVLASTLATPLMVYLARTGYTPPRTDPADLTAFTDPAALQDHLLRQYLPAVYGDQSANARRWLVFLARHLQRRGSQDIVWWELIHALRFPRAAGGAAVGLALAAGMTVMMVAVGLAVGDGLTVLIGIGLSAVIGLAIGFLREYAGNLPEWSGPRRLLRMRPAHVTTALAIGCAAGLLVGIPLGIGENPDLGARLGTAVGLVTAFIVGVSGNAVGPMTRDDLTDPHLVLRSERTAMLALVLGGAGSCALAGTVVGQALFGLVAGFGFWLWVAAAGSAGTSWIKYQAARAWLAATGNLPWRLGRFLDDAHRRGVLRQAGAAYQFRHSRLQHHLARRS